MTRLTVEKIRAMSTHDRRTLFKNALEKQASPEAQAVLAMFDEVGRPDLADEQVRLDDPVGRQMERIVFSPEGRVAALQATAEGKPAMAGIEPLLIAALGTTYRALNGATVQAGYLVARMMDAAGYEQTGKKGKLSKGSVAKTAEIFAPKRRQPR